MAGRAGWLLLIVLAVVLVAVTGSLLAGLIARPHDWIIVAWFTLGSLLGAGADRMLRRGRR